MLLRPAIGLIRAIRWLALGVVATMGLLLGEPPARTSAQVVSYYITTTEDLPPTSRQCQAGQPCTFRAALGRAQTQQAVVRACYDPAETPGSVPCPLGAQPLRKSDPGFDAATGRWVIRIADGLIPFEISGARTAIDFTLDIRDWHGPKDNRVVIDSGERKMAHGFLVHGNDIRLAGFEIRGDFVNAAILLRADIDGNGASNNQLGPGLILAAITEGVGIRIQNPQSVNNRVVGSWCGITGDGTIVKGLRDDCIQLSDGTWGNTIGGPDARDRNVLAASALGSGVHILGAGTHENAVQGNWIGLDAAGQRALDPETGLAGLETGVTITDDAAYSRILDNVIAGNRSAGIAIFDDSQGTVISRNTIGETQDRAACLGNNGHGIRIQGLPKMSGIVDNRIACNKTSGVTISGSNARDNRVSHNSITNNNGHPLDVVQGANGGVAAPTLEVVTENEVRGRSCRGCLVEIFSDPAGEADSFEGQAVARTSDGTFIIPAEDGAFTHRLITATASDGQNTSHLSAWKVVPVVTPTPTAGGPVPTAPPTPTRDPGAYWSIWLPDLLRDATR